MSSAFPIVAEGMHLYTLIRDQGGSGNDAPRRLVVSTRGQDVYVVLANSKVSNQEPGTDGFQ